MRQYTGFLIESILMKGDMGLSVRFSILYSDAAATGVTCELPSHNPRPLNENPHQSQRGQEMHQILKMRNDKGKYKYVLSCPT